MLVFNLWISKKKLKIHVKYININYKNSNLKNFDVEKHVKNKNYL